MIFSEKLIILVLIIINTVFTYVKNFKNLFENFAKELNKLLMNLFNISHSFA